ncbi:MAG: hypothetical protein IT204_12635 [Fimbriimonadaceae bacterium]|nr:hypothetical protein [Fimbriimonadaceae bacterium]
MAPVEWTLEQPQAAWPPRDSVGEVVWRDQLWMLGGWYTPQTANPCDVWRSADGVAWECLQPAAPWVQSDLSAAYAFRDRLWICGGRSVPGTACSSRCWSSADGVEWTLEATAAWSPRLAAAHVVWRDRLWLLGGTANFYDHSPTQVHHDVWSSADGRHWELVTPHAPWPARAHHQALVLNDRLYLLGGGLWHPEHLARNDVWVTDNGVDWTCLTAAAPWAPRLWFGAQPYRGLLWVLGGWSREHGNFGDAWCSPDGTTWTAVPASTCWSPRHEPCTWVFRDRLWLAAGHAEPLSGEVWSLHLPPAWQPT